MSRSIRAMCQGTAGGRPRAATSTSIGRRAWYWCGRNLQSTFRRSGGQVECPPARPLLDLVLTDRIAFTPAANGSYELTAPITFPADDSCARVSRSVGHRCATTHHTGRCIYVNVTFSNVLH